MRDIGGERRGRVQRGKKDRLQRGWREGSAKQW